MENDNEKIPPIPENWFVMVDPENAEFLNKYKPTERRYSAGAYNYISSDGKGWNILRNVSASYCQITAKQFEKYVINANKTICGYELKYPQYEKIAIRALNLSNKEAYKPFIIAGMISYYIPKIIELGMMDWFEPVYEEEKTLPIINGFSPKLSNSTGFRNGFISYGCEKFPVSMFERIIEINNHEMAKKAGFNRTIKSIRLNSGTEISIEQIEQIVNYFDK